MDDFFNDERREKNQQLQSMLSFYFIISVTQLIVWLEFFVQKKIVNKQDEMILTTHDIMINNIKSELEIMRHSTNDFHLFQWWFCVRWCSFDFDWILSISSLTQLILYIHEPYDNQITIIDRLSLKPRHVFSLLLKFHWHSG